MDGRTTMPSTLSVGGARLDRDGGGGGGGPDWASAVPGSHSNENTPETISRNDLNILL